MTRQILFLGALTAAGILSVTTAGAPSAAGSAITRVSVSSTGRQADAPSYPDAISSDGRVVVFHSDASTLVPGDTNRTADVFVRDRTAGTTQRVSVSSSGNQGNGQSALAAAVSASGRYVAFVSSASNLVRGDTNRALDVFLRDLKTGTTTRMSLGKRTRQGNGESTGVAISANGRFVAFTSLASNLVRGDTNATADVFVRDRRTTRTTRISVSSQGAQASGRTRTRNGSQVQSISADGRFVAFQSDAPNLVRHDTNRTVDLFVRDRRTGTTSRVNLGPGGRQANGESDDARLSADGRYVAFQSLASNLVAGDGNDSTDVFLRDRRTGRTTRISAGPGAKQSNGSSFSPWISADGRLVSFASDASNLVEGDTNDLGDLFVHDQVDNTTQRLSVGDGGGQAEGASLWGELSANGRSLAFVSSAANLVPGDTNDLLDVFVRDLAGAGFDSAASTKPLVVRGGTANLIAPGDRVDVSYTVYSGSKAVSGALYVRNDRLRRFVRLPLRRGTSTGAPLHRVVPARLIRGRRLFYYAVVHDPRSGHSLTIPAAGGRRPASAWLLHKPVVVRLGTHRFGHTRQPDAIVARARAGQVGFENTDLYHFGPQTFLVGRDGSVWLHDGLDQRLLVWSFGQPDTITRSVHLPFFAGVSDLTFGPAGTIYMTHVIVVDGQKRLVLDRLDAAGNVLWERPLGGFMDPSAWTFQLGVNSPLRVGPDGTLFLLAFMGAPSDEWGWMPVATPAGEPVPPAGQRSGTHWPYQPFTNRLRLIGGEVYSPHEDSAPHDLRYALVDRRDRVVRSWRILSRTEMYFHLTVPEAAGADPVVVVDFADGSSWEYEVLRLGPHGTTARFSLRRSVWGSSVLPDLRVGPDGSLYQLATSVDKGVTISRYSLRLALRTQAKPPLGAASL